MQASEVKISHPDKELFPESGYTKNDLVKYYKQVADWMIPHVKGRPLTFKSFPSGIEKEGFFRKNAADHFPDYVERIEVPVKGKKLNMASADEAADLFYFAGQNVIELHAALSTIKNLKKPDQMIFDLDPSTNDFEIIRKVAQEFKKLLDKLSLPSFLKTSGSRGVHIHVPIKVNMEFDEVKATTRKICEKLVKEMPQETTLKLQKNQRGNKVFIDYLRTEYGQTSIAAYSPRAKKGAPVAVPIRWDELSRKSMQPQKYNIQNIQRRLSKIKDPWKDFYSSKVKCPKAASLE